MESKEFLQLCKQKIEEYFNNDNNYDNINISENNIYVVWYCKSLQNHKALLSTDVPDGIYYEITYNGDKNELYFDVYKKHKNKCFKLNNKVGY